MFAKVPLRLAKWLAALGQQATAKDTTGVCFGKAVGVRERAEREQTPRAQVPAVGQNRGVQVGGERSKWGGDCLPGLRWETSFRWERTWARSATLKREATMCVLGRGRCERRGKGNRTWMCFAETSVRVHSRNPDEYRVKERKSTAYPSSAPWITEFTPRWYKASLEAGGLLLGVEKGHKDGKAPSAPPPSTLSLGLSSQPLFFSQWSGSLQAEKYSPAWHIAK